ncbi:oxidoreductase [Dactylosporangium sp. AC04546]|uniref:oxidoreductase n=1 Tax=Dactylosporangium sp. AC04546 TaxID=2862460 RepID=UPI001EDD097D|nr:oxidoreductase [Dactylosporangium sp. AC04546]WVK88184.1 oxidoreductase [Dactylosporangium sp. AC04546]
MPRWTETDVPDQRGQVAVVTGANTGIGFETARVLARRGATVVLACRDPARGGTAAEKIGAADTVRLDLASLASVRDAAETIRRRYDRIDLLVNNAGVTGMRGRTEDGFELQFGVNHLGHFALTGLLLDRLHDARIVTVSSIGHRLARLDLTGDTADPQRGRGDAYSRSKLANLLFTHELHRRLRAAGHATQALAAHPGGATTEIFRYSSPWFRVPNLLIARLLGRTPAMGALPTLRAATDPTATSGEYYGPDGLLEIRGYPRRVEASRRAHDPDAQRRLWEASERLTGVKYAI